MAQTLEHNKAVTTVVPVSIPTFDDDLAIIQKLDDEPNDVGGLTAMELKAKFDEGNVTAQQYINNVLIPAVVADDLTEQTRAAAEAERVANEIERVESETNRLSAENARVTNEANRVIAETAREQAEQARVNSTTGIVAQATAKASEATAAASAAAQDASSARTSAESAQSASGIASSASNAAQAAATSASSSASTANSAANRASASESSAASSAETAKRYAEQASSAGSGDMLQSVYDPTGKRQDVFKYVDTKVSNIPTPDVSGQIDAHNTDSSAHADIRASVNNKAHIVVSASVEQIPSAGWYRVFKLNSPTPTTCLMQIGHEYYSGGSESVTALARVDIHATGITVLNHSTYSGKHYYQKIRITQNDSENARYVDVYYGQAGNSPVAKCIDIGGTTGGGLTNMVAMNFEPVAETVSGETVKLVQATSKIPNGDVLTQGSITASTTDLTAGSSPLANGQLYFVYE